MSFEGAGYSRDAFLDGRVILTQPKEGYRVAMDSVLLAACVPAKAGQIVLEGGIGSGGAALCLASRVSGVSITGIEIDGQMRDLALHNIKRNNMQDRISLKAGDIRRLEGDGSAYDHVMMNPPFLAHGHAIAPPVQNKGQAHAHAGTTLRDWIRWAIHHCKARGSISIIYRADHLDQVITALAGATGDMLIMPFWPRAGQPAKRVIVQARKGTKGRAVLLAGMALHTEGRRYSIAAEKILRDAAFLNLKALARSGA